MIGFYNYTVVLTYLSLISASTGIFVSLSDKGHPYIGIMFLLFSGLCDAFDGKVARTKVNRAPEEKKFGIQIDSLSDIIAFGVLPAAIGATLLRVQKNPHDAVETGYIFGKDVGTWGNIFAGFLFAVLGLYILAALIRLAYFNVTEEARQETETSCRKEYVGLPVTSSALIFPSFMLVRYILSIYCKQIDITLIYFILLVATGIGFISPFKMKKPGIKGILIMVGIGLAELITFLVLFRLHGQQ